MPTPTPTRERDREPHGSASSASRRVWFACLAIAGMSLAAGCSSTKRTSFRPGLEPLETLRVPASSEPYPDEVISEVGQTEAYEWGHARAYVRAPIADVYAALHDPAVVDDARTTDRQTHRQLAETSYDHAFEIDYAVDKFITVEWTVQYRFGVVEGTREQPVRALVRFQKTVGTEHISVLEGSILCRRVAADVTELQMVKHIKAARSSLDKLADGFEHVVARVRARVSGQPLPR